MPVALHGAGEVHDITIRDVLHDDSQRSGRVGDTAYIQGMSITQVIADAERHGNHDLAYRLFIQSADDLATHPGCAGCVVDRAADHRHPLG